MNKAIITGNDTNKFSRSLTLIKWSANSEYKNSVLFSFDSLNGQNSPENVNIAAGKLVFINSK